ncbi:hypothetical protein GQ53DRAFT_885021 [Thozetella sp. PMI_491]|nr:hypothetical protein GQ53DRAFT_885021 [Thozetella sp. PMI_491]
MQRPKTLKSGEYHTEAEWEEIRDRFVTLYKIQGKALPEVRKTLAEKYGFNATLRQYKSRVVKWNVTKKSSLKRPVGASESLTRAVQEWRPGAGRSTITIPIQHPPTPPLTPPPSPPGHLGVIQAATFGISRFYSGVLMGEIDRSQVRTQKVEWNIRQFFDTANSVSTMASAARWPQAQDLYSQMLDHVGPLLEDRNPIVVVALLQICARFYQEGQGPVLQRFLNFLIAMASARGLESHPLRILASAWAEPGEHSFDLITMCSQQAIDIMTEQLGPEHAQTLSGWRALHSAQYARGDYAGALASISHAAEIEERLKLGDFLALDARFRAIRCTLSMHDLEASTNNIKQLESAFRDFSLTDQATEQLVRRMGQNIQTVKLELMRREMDPRAELLIARMVEGLKSTGDTRDAWVLIYAERLLAATKKSVKKGQPEHYTFTRKYQQRPALPLDLTALKVIRFSADEAISAAPLGKTEAARRD